MKFLLSRTGVRVAIVVIVLVLAGWYLFGGRSRVVRFVTAAVTKGPIIRSVVATGTVNPVVTVQIGTYVSGPITEIYADFNSAVKKGQVIAKIDPRPYAAQVALSSAALADAKAQYEKDAANLKYQKVTYERDQALIKDEAVSQDQVDNQRSVYNQAVAQLGVDAAAIKQQEATLRNAQLNLNYTNIVSPVDGTVVARNVDVGQTVAASFQTPILFLVAKDLTKMQVDANVSESDIGNVRVGEAANFKVDAFPDRSFQGVVGQVRQAPITVQNVVTYDVVVNVDNPELLLKPGMTANVTIVTARRDDAVRIPIEALRFKPRESHRQFAQLADDPAPAPDGAISNSHSAKVWIRTHHGIRPVPVTIGLDDGVNVQMLSGPLKPGQMVVTDEIQPTTTQSHAHLHFPR